MKKLTIQELLDRRHRTSDNVSTTMYPNGTVAIVQNGATIHYKTVPRCCIRFPNNCFNTGFQLCKFCSLQFENAANSCNLCPGQLVPVNLNPSLCAQQVSPEVLCPTLSLTPPPHPPTQCPTSFASELIPRTVFGCPQPRTILVPVAFP